MAYRTKVSSGKLLATFVALSIGLVLPAAAAQQPTQYNPSSSNYPETTNRDVLMTAAVTINNQRSEAIRKRDMAGITAAYTADATYIELMPKLVLTQGRAPIQHHFQELFDARTTDLTSTVTSAEMTGNDTALVGGDYYLVTGNKRIAGHFVQTLRRESGTWKIASHVFARPEAVTATEMSDFRGN